MLASPSTSFRSVVLLLLSMAWAVAVQAEAQRDNPFDLVHRKEAPQVVATGVPQAVPTQPLVPKATVRRNPFDLIGRSERSAEDVAAMPPPVNLSEQSSSVASGDPGRRTFDVFLLVALLVLLTGSYLSQGPAMQRLLSASLNENFLTRLRRDPRKASFWWWTFAGLVSIGVFGFVAMRQLEVSGVYSTWTSVAAVVGLVLSVVLAKASLLALLRAAFPLDTPIDTYLTLVYVTATALGLLLLPVTVVVTFSADGLATILAYIGAGMIVLAYLVLAVRATGISNRFVLSYPLHFLVYLCALEIGPLAVGYKLLMG